MKPILTFALTCLLIGLTSIVGITKDPISDPESFDVKIKASFFPAGPKSSISNRGDIVGFTSCHKDILNGGPDPHIYLRAWDHKGQILPEDIYALGNELLRALNCLYPGRFPNPDELPKGWDIDKRRALYE